ncbi:MAG: hypothetical protein LBL72_02960, partial [Candidatus Accumulibacter sp.]|nr:hypothetical protein [Accumulibacter sp.]
MGEVLGQIAESGKVTNWTEVFLEVAGEFGGAPAEVYAATREIFADRDEKRVKTRIAEETAKFVEQLNKLASADKVLQRDPETFESFIREVAEDGPVSHVYFDAKTLYQAGLTEQLAASSPSAAEQLPDALETGGQIAIPVEEYAARIAPTESAPSLVDHIKVDPEGFSRAEAAAWIESGAAEELKAAVHSALQSTEEEKAFQASADAVKETMKAQLDAAGRFDSRINEAYATLVGSFYATQAGRLGTTPEALYQRAPLKVVAADGDAAFGKKGNGQNVGIVFNQGDVGVTDEIDETTGLALNDDGTVTVYHHTSAENAARIREEGVLRSAGEPDLFFTTRADADTGYGDTVI